MTDEKKPSAAIASAVSAVIEERKEDLQRSFQYRCTHCSNEYPAGRHGSMVCAECGEPMQVHQFEAAPEKKAEEDEDVLVSLGDLSEAKIGDITYGKNFETVALDYIATFNLAVTQGMAPIKALQAMVQALVIVMGLCLRAGLKSTIAFGMVKLLINKIRSSEGDVRIVTTSLRNDN